MEENLLHSGMAAVARVIGEPARAQILCCLMDGRARTSTELAVVADVSPSTASAHLSKLTQADLVRVHPQGKHRYYSLKDMRVAEMLEGMMVLSRDRASPFMPSTPRRRRAARTCYDHMAGALAVALHDRMLAMRWIAADVAHDGYTLTEKGQRELERLGVDVEAARHARRRFVCPCMDWSERRPHLGGSIGAALLSAALHRGWVVRELDSRCLQLTQAGGALFGERLRVQVPAAISLR